MKVVHTIYLDYQATTPVDPRVAEVMIPHLTDVFGNPHSSDHCVGWRAAEALKEATARIARFIGADPDEIIFTSGATESNNLALLGFGRRAAGGKRRRILTSPIEHKCVLAVGRVLKEQLGYTVEQLPVDSEGRILIPALEEAMDDDVLIVSIMAVNNEIGTIQDVPRISDIVRSRGAALHCDAAQAPGAIELDSISNSVDFLSLSAHKMYGPKGIGVLFVRREFQPQIEPLIYGGGQQKNLRSGTVPVALCVGMGSAAEILCTDQALKEREMLRRRRDRLVENLLALPWPITLNGPQGIRRHPGNANLRFDGFSAHDILAALQPHLAASTGSACTSGIPEPSHVLRAIGLSRRQAEASIRFSPGFKTTDAEIDRATTLIRDVLSRLPNDEG
jgi:cysteine desulfurase